jgi:glycosyltransferase involved in cell wall biosynthesis
MVPRPDALMDPRMPNTHPPRVVHVIQNLNYGGMERVLHSLARHLPPRGFEVHVVVLQYLGRFAEGLEGLATFHQVPPMSRLSLLYPARLTALFRRLAPDLVHSHTGVWLKAATAARGAGVPAMVHTEHGRPDPVPLADRLIDNRASRRTDVVIAVSDALAGVLRRQVVHNPASVMVIKNGIDTEHLAPAVDRAALREGLGLPVRGSIVGSIGRLEPIKNYQLALHAFARLPAGTDGPWLVLVGDGSERGALENLAASLGIAGRVKFLGWRTDAERIYGAFDLFTLPSRSEGTSVSLLEAMSSGVCPVVTDVGGNRSVLGPELEALLVPDNNDAGLAEGWSRCLADPALRERYGTAARARVQKAFSLQEMVGQHERLYRSLLARPRRPC